MECFVNKVVNSNTLPKDAREYIPNAGLRRRMSKVVRNGVACAIECYEDIEHIATADAIITASGFGCLTDSERFLHNLTTDNEELLNPTPFIQSTFNTVGGQIALLAKNHNYNVTYVNRSHSFEDALLDALMRFADGEANNILLGAFDEETPSQKAIMTRMGLFRKTECSEGVMFAHLTASVTDKSIAKVSKIDFHEKSLSENECIEKYTSQKQCKLLYNSYKEYGLFPTASALCFQKAIEHVAAGEKQVILYNEYLGGTPTIVVVECIG